jgi:class 3 adenylate cyclase
MSVKFSTFDAMTRQNKINTLMQIKEAKNQKKEDYYLALHAMLDNEIQVSLPAKMVAASFSDKSWLLDFSELSSVEARENIAEFLRANIGFGPELVESLSETDKQQLAQKLKQKQKKFESFQEWDGSFPETARLLNTLREDTQKIIQQMLLAEEKIERAYLCFYSDTLQPFRDLQRSLDSNSATTVVNLNRIHNLADISPVFPPLFALLNRPIYLLAIFTSKRGFLFLRDELKTSQAAVIGFSLQTISSVKTVKQGTLLNLEIETPQDIIVIPMLECNDAYEASVFLKEKSIEAIEAQEEFIERDFEHELKKLDMLFKAKAIKNSEYIFRKSRLQKMELEKFSDANIELLLAKRFSDQKMGEKFDEQLLKKFTFEKTIMFTDIVGFSSTASEKMLLDTMTLLAVHDKLLMPIIEENQGKLIKKIGDALMVRFDDPLQACHAAMRMQSELAEFNQKSEDKILIRIGLNTGTVFEKNDDIFGDAVNVAARMESLAQPGKIFITEGTRNLVGNEISCHEVGLRKVKGKDEPIRVYTISGDSEAAHEMAELADQFTEQTGISNESADETYETEKKSESETLAQFNLPDPENSKETEEREAVRDPVLEMICSIDSARQSYIQAVKNGSNRNADLEDWFARYEEYIKPNLDL